MSAAPRIADSGAAENDAVSRPSAASRGRLLATYFGYCWRCEAYRYHDSRTGGDFCAACGADAREVRFLRVPRAAAPANAATVRVRLGARCGEEESA